MLRLLSCAGLAAAAIAMPAAVDAQSRLTPDEVATELVERFGVEVLNVDAAERDGKPVLIVTVMEPGGDSNSAFLVTKLVVDATTGSFAPARHAPATWTDGETFWSAPGADGMTIRRRTFAR